MRGFFQHRRWALSALLLWCLSEISLSVSVSSTKAEEEILNGAVGDSITFPTRVTVSGALMYEGSNIGKVVSKEAETDVTEKFKNRLHWNSQSGFFTLSDLRTEDSGVYTVQSMKEEKRKQDYQLNVYDKASAPPLTELNPSPPESELSKPVTKQTTTVNSTEHCFHHPGGTCTHRSHIPAFVSVVGLVAAVIGGICWWRKRHQNEFSQHTVDSFATNGLHDEELHKHESHVLVTDT